MLLKTTCIKGLATRAILLSNRPFRWWYLVRALHVFGTSREDFETDSLFFSLVCFLLHKIHSFVPTYMVPYIVMLKVTQLTSHRPELPKQ